MSEPSDLLNPVHPINWCTDNDGFLTNDKKTCYISCQKYVNRDSIIDQPIPDSYFDESCFAKGREGMPLLAKDAANDVVACENKYKNPGISWDHNKIRCIEFAMPVMIDNRTPFYKPFNADQVSRNDKSVNVFLIPS